MSERIRSIRKYLRMNQGDFARQIGLKQNALSAIELGNVALTEKNIKLVCTMFAVDETWLRTGTGEMFGPSSPYERELLAIFGKLTAETQEFILEMARNLLKRQEKSQGKR